MRSRRARLVRGALLFGAGALCASLVAVAIGNQTGQKNIRETSRSEGTPIIGLRPTGIGLPLVNIEGTVGAGDIGAELDTYHDSGLYAKDLAAVGKRALGYLQRQVPAIRQAASRRCRRARERGLSGDALARACRKPRLAIVLDIDETSLSNYDCLAASDFTQATAALAVCVAMATAPAIAPTLALYRYAERKGVAQFLITGRPEPIPGARMQTEANLALAGYEKWEGLILAPDISVDTPAYKSGERKKIEMRGYRIVLNIGDQESDLEGGHADRAFKVPNPFYIIGD